MPTAGLKATIPDELLIALAFMLLFALVVWALKRYVASQDVFNKLIEARIQAVETRQMAGEVSAKDIFVSAKTCETCHERLVKGQETMEDLVGNIERRFDEIDQKIAASLETMARESQKTSRRQLILTETLVMVCRGLAEIDTRFDCSRIDALHSRLQAEMEG
jgi:hypothetical protein